MKDPKQLADEHWDWLETIILESMRMEMLLFKSAMVHGYKHGVEDTKNEGIRTKSREKRQRLDNPTG